MKNKKLDLNEYLSRIEKDMIMEALNVNDFYISETAKFFAISASMFHLSLGKNRIILLFKNILNSKNSS